MQSQEAAHCILSLSMSPVSVLKKILPARRELRLNLGAFCARELQKSWIV